jgi:hypothetical protein
MIEAVCDIELETPYEGCRQTVHRLAIIKKIRIIQSFMNATVMRVGIPVSLFEQWYGVKPEMGLYPSPKGASGFIVSVRVRKVVVL